VTWRSPDTYQSAGSERGTATSTSTTTGTTSTSGTLGFVDNGDDHALAEEMLTRYQTGESKSTLEIEYWDDGTSHGKRFTGFVRKQLGIDTEGRSRQSLELERLSALLRRHGVSPSPAGDLSVEDRLVANSRQAAVAAVRLYNDPSAGFRTETFIVIMVIAWNCLLQAKLEADGVEYREVDGDGSVAEVDGRARYLGTWELTLRALHDPKHAAVRWNLDFFLKLRHLIEHRYLPAVDVAVVGEAQAMLLNYENVLVAWFGEEAQLGSELVVPLQLSQLRGNHRLSSLKRLQAELPVDVVEFLTRHRSDVPVEVLRSPEYALQLFFVPVSANRERSADAVVRFLRPGEVPEDVAEALQKIAVVAKPKPVSVVGADLLSPTEVTNLVGSRLPFRFTLHSHARCWRHYNVRPPDKAAEPAATQVDYCLYDKLLKGYGYTQAWVDFLVEQLSDGDHYRQVVGTGPTPV